MKNRNPIMPEEYEGSISLTLRTWSSKKPLRMLARNWKKNQWLLPCLARQARKVSMERPVAKPVRSKQNLRVTWKPVNPQDCVWENLYRFIMRTILQEKETIHCSITIWFTNLFSCPKPWKFAQQRQQWTRNGKNWRKFRRGTWQKSEVKKRWSMKQGRRAQKFISSWISYPDCQGALDKQLMQYLFIPRLKWKMLQNYWKIQNRNVQTFGSVYHDTNGRSHGPVWKIQSFLLSEIFMVILWQDCDGIGNLRKSYWNVAGRRFPMGNACSYIIKRVILICVYGWQKIGWKETKHRPTVEGTDETSGIGRTNIFPRSCILGVYSKTMWNKQGYSWQL